MIWYEAFGFGCLGGAVPDQLRILAHSLRGGFATSAARAGLAEREIMATTRYRSTTVLRRYIRDGELFAHNVTAEIGL